ncbi:hypothetical protein FACS189491_09400 [Spirochaetia bacterium]|nr:hypothetical protein FACS189491_09400 [Spirochaetia bacterium]
MKVLFLTNIPSPYRVDFFEELGKCVDLTVWFEASGHKDREWKIKDLGNNFTYKVLHGFTLGVSIHINFEIIALLRKYRFDKYIIGGYSSPTDMMAILWLKINRIPFILNADGGFIKLHEKKPIGLIKKYFISSAAEWLSSGKNCTEYLQYYGAVKQRIHEYPFVTTEYSRDDLTLMSEKLKAGFKEKYNLRGLVIITVGSFIYRKGIDIVLKAFKNIEYNNVSLLIVGGGGLKEEYLRYIDENKMTNVIILDFMEKKHLVELYKISDIFVLQTRLDIWGLVVNEAMTFGLPVITTSCCGAAYNLVAEGKNGYILEPENDTDLTAKLKELLDDQEKRKRFGDESLHIIQDYSMDKMVKRHVEILSGAGT